MTPISLAAAAEVWLLGLLFKDALRSNILGCGSLRSAQGSKAVDYPE
jgi:hypothetical protein